MDMFVELNSLQELLLSDLKIRNIDGLVEIILWRKLVKEHYFNVEKSES